MNIIAPKKLIELALPLKDINEAAADRLRGGAIDRILKLKPSQRPIPR